MEKTNVAKLPTADLDDYGIAMDRCSVKDIIEGKNEIAKVSHSYIDSIRTKQVIRNGFFGAVYMGTDTVLHRSFAIKAIHTDIISGGNSSNVPKMEAEFLKEIKVRP